ncbi:MAG: ABC transporter substrate-binding protein [Chloroflexi bacterium]|nr:ABC transporter substrate-binding protein [Chloroflexota bacterium]MCY3570751.1 ABC transporter substrate-binding protein [Chloroflexota bacterium]MCY3684837.1 ABC transporter substrate-binding protein [Chloroflexota bacterium]MCY3696681.1 ABC transporter substrate-binding protein [Chloroflexota bacterium]
MSRSFSLRWTGLLALLTIGWFLLACASDEPPQAQQAAEQQADAQAAQPAAQEQQAEAQSQAEEQAATQQTQSSPASARTLEGVRGIVDPSNRGWPREVEGLNGVVSIPAKPLRIITASVGHDEMTLALVPNERLVAVGSATKNSTYSNVAALVQDKPEISRDPEVIVAQSPDVVVTSPFFPVEAIDALERVGIVVVQTELIQSPEARINSILLMGYIFGEEERAFEFADEVQGRYESLISVTGAKSPQPNVLALTQYSDTLWVAGGNSTEGGVIVAAGGVNAAEVAGITGNQTTSLEGVIAMAPDIIVIAQPIEFGAEEFRQSLLDNEALAEVPAIRDGAVHVVESKHFTTLSYWNIRGAEDLARLLWPDDFPNPPTESFSLAE